MTKVLEFINNLNLLSSLTKIDFSNLTLNNYIILFILIILFISFLNFCQKHILKIVILSGAITILYIKMGGF